MFPRLKINFWTAFAIVILFAFCSEKKEVSSRQLENNGYYESHFSKEDINSENSFLIQEAYFNKDSFLINDVSYFKKDVPERESLYSNFTDSLGYGIVIFYDSIPDKVKHVEIVAVIRSKSNKKRYKIFSQKYLKQTNPKAYEDWIKKTKDDGFEYPIDSYH